jgi:thiol-disulfide isomerase/thioredoxin
VVHDLGGRAAFVVENYGESPLATRFGVTRYPAIFVDDILVATPNDFGFYGKSDEQKGGRYAPLKSAASHERFRADLRHMIDLVLAGKKDAARAAAAPAPSSEVAAFPEVAITTLDGAPVARDSLKGKIVLVEIWATWCPPCRGTLRWLADLAKKHGDRVAVVTLAIESDAAAVAKVASEIGGGLVWATGTPEIVRAFGDVSAVPTLLVFDRQGRAAGSFFGAPPSLHGDAEARLSRLLAD